MYINDGRPMSCSNMNIHDGRLMRAGYGRNTQWVSVQGVVNVSRWIATVQGCLSITLCLSWRTVENDRTNLIETQPDFIVFRLKPAVDGTQLFCQLSKAVSVYLDHIRPTLRPHTPRSYRKIYIILIHQLIRRRHQKTYDIDTSIIIS